mmetsp:Transcript_105257/g.267438  ORF Transcript_105257/g.267438 Transcript_105257/m.267438 type:complete len:214 (+) Transcript_105257:72-713(+)
MAACAGAAGLARAGAAPGETATAAEPRIWAALRFCSNLPPGKCRLRISKNLFLFEACSASEAASPAPQVTTTSRLSKMAGHLHSVVKSHSSCLSCSTLFASSLRRKRSSRSRSASSPSLAAARPRATCMKLRMGPFTFLNHSCSKQSASRSRSVFRTWIKPRIKLRACSLMPLLKQKLACLTFSCIPAPSKGYAPSNIVKSTTPRLHKSTVSS